MTERSLSVVIKTPTRHESGSIEAQGHRIRRWSQFSHEIVDGWTLEATSGAGAPQAAPYGPLQSIARGQVIHSGAWR